MRMRNVDIFSLFGNTWDTFFKRYYPGHYHVVCNAISPMTLLLNRVLKHDKLGWGGGSKKKFWIFFILLNKYHLNFEIYLNIK